MTIPHRLARGRGGWLPKSLAAGMPAYPRRQQTAVAIKKPALPIGTSITRAKTHCGMQTHGVYRGAPILSIWSIRSTWSISKRHAP
ncbi:MAG: hypothetical protein IKA32_02940, partial [Lentisphaeria bacterium]|nr:hypothetical protein [Lentisphaeria bacterium]